MCGIVDYLRNRCPNVVNRGRLTRRIEHRTPQGGSRCRIRGIVRPNFDVVVRIRNYAIDRQQDAIALRGRVVVEVISVKSVRFWRQSPGALARSALVPKSDVEWPTSNAFDGHRVRGDHLALRTCRSL